MINKNFAKDKDKDNDNNNYNYFVNNVIFYLYHINN